MSVKQSPGEAETVSVRIPSKLVAEAVAALRAYERMPSGGDHRHVMYVRGRRRIRHAKNLIASAVLARVGIPYAADE